MVEVGLLDWVLWLGFAILFFLILFFYKQTRDDQEKYKYFLTGFAIKLVGGLAFAFIYLYYYGFGDTFLYFNGAETLVNTLLRDPGDYVAALKSEHGNIPGHINYLKSQISFSRTSEEWFMVKLMSPLALLGMKSYLVVTLFTSTIAFWGSWKLYLVFEDITKKTFWAFAAAFLVPSVVFWSSGLIKDTITLAALNYMIYMLYFWINDKQFSIYKLMLAILCAYIIFQLKSYILIAFVPSFGLILYFTFSSRIKSLMLKMATIPLMLGLLVTSIFFGIETLAEQSDKYQADQLETQVKGFHSWHTDVGGSSYSLGEVEYTAQGVLSKVPAALNVTLFRPYIWEAGSPVVLVTALESLVFFILFIRAFFINRLRIFKKLKEYAFLKGSIAFILLFGFAVGFTSYNFGALARYKTPIMGFVAIILILINLKKKKELKTYSLETT